MVQQQLQQQQQQGQWTAPAALNVTKFEASLAALTHCILKTTLQYERVADYLRGFALVLL